jgi:hypothetical protein
MQHYYILWCHITVLSQTIQPQLAQNSSIVPEANLSWTSISPGHKILHLSMKPRCGQHRVDLWRVKSLDRAIPKISVPPAQRLRAGYFGMPLPEDFTCCNNCCSEFLLWYPVGTLWVSQYNFNVYTRWISFWYPRHHSKKVLKN